MQPGPVFVNVYVPMNRFCGIDSASVCSLALRHVKYRVVVPTRQARNRFLGSFKGLQIRALVIGQ
jgi:hypothetical protein